MTEASGLAPRPKRKGGRPRKYSDEQRAEIVAAIEREYKGNISAACRAFGVPVNTVMRWYQPTARSGRVSMPMLPSQELIDLKGMQLTGIFESIVAKYALYLTSVNLDELRTKPNIAAVVLGILFDKLQVMKGEPTHITQTNVRYMEPGSLKALAKRKLEVLDGGRNQASG